jgi:hypothetical protein
MFEKMCGKIRKVKEKDKYLYAEAMPTDLEASNAESDIVQVSNAQASLSTLEHSSRRACSQAQSWQMLIVVSLDRPSELQPAVGHPLMDKFTVSVAQRLCLTESDHGWRRKSWTPCWLTLGDGLQPLTAILHFHLRHLQFKDIPSKISLNHQTAVKQMSPMPPLSAREMLFEQISDQIEHV